MVIESVGLTKAYGDFIAVNELSFEVNEGECFGILGPNGAGKTSLFKMMYGSSEITKGELFILGMSARDHMTRIKGQLGVMPQQILHVGDCINNDYYAAVQAGCRAIWYNTKNDCADITNQVSTLRIGPFLPENWPTKFAQPSYLAPFPTRN